MLCDTTIRYEKENLLLINLSFYLLPCLLKKPKTAPPSNQITPTAREAVITQDSNVEKKVIHVTATQIPSSKAVKTTKPKKPPILRVLARIIAFIFILSLLNSVFLLPQDLF